MEGNSLKIFCSYKEEDEYDSRPISPAVFYKDGVFIGKHDAGKKTFPAVSKSDEGLYKCEHPSKGESPQSFLAVRGDVILCFLSTVVQFAGNQP